MLYSQEDKQNLRKQLIRRIALTAAIFLVPFACGLVIMYTSRQQWLSWLLSVVGMAAAVLFYGLCVSPFVAYAKYLREVTAGMSRSFQGGLLREESVSVREGVRCRTLYFSDEEKEGEERLCYLDQEKPFDFSKDRTYRITVHGQSIIEIETLDENKAV